MNFFSHTFRHALRHRVRDTAFQTAGRIFDQRGGLYRADGLSFEIPTDATTRHCRGRFLLGYHERHERALLKRYLRPGARVLELAACLGILSCLTNRQLADPQKHVVVEPDPRAMHGLHRNRERNGCAFAIERCLIGPGGEAPFHLRRTAGGRISPQGTVETVMTPLVPIEALEAKHGFHFDTLIMDIEGAEKAFVQDQQTARARFAMVLIEHHPAFLTKAEQTAVRDGFRRAGLSLMRRRGAVEVWQR